ncbi:conserved hypothetical protein [Echinococcus multilocularis]|uniref:Uncharacterized protein n=1 Tax=Echinococcus multilocularis TaxID=6211 RepID=A0A087W0Z9_ECHMU|nr:conserved hypothetical protein [Echinococcus multilocularis]
MENSNSLKNLETILCQPQIVQQLLGYLTLDEWLKFVSAFPRWNYSFPHEILLSENGSPLLLFLLRRHLTKHIHTLRLTSPGPIAQGGAVGSIHKCILSNPSAFVCLERLDLSVQMQPIDRLLAIFAAPAFPHLRYLSVRPTEPDCGQNPVCVAPLPVFAPPQLEVMKCHLIGFLADDGEEYIPALLQVMQNVVNLTVCERMIGATPWLQYLRRVGPFANLETLQIHAKSDLLKALNKMLFSEEWSFFPKLKSVNISTVSRSRTSIPFKNGFFCPLEIDFSNFGQPMEISSTLPTNEAIQVGRRALIGRGLIMLELIFLPDNINLSSSTTLAVLNQFGHMVETLIITVQHTVVLESSTDYLAFLKRFKTLCHLYLFPIIKLTSRSLKVIELPVELIDSRDVDSEFEALLVCHRGYFSSVKSVSITSPTAFAFCNLSQWHSCHCLDNIPHTQPLKNVCGLFLNLEELFITSDSHLDPEDLQEAVELCPELKRLYINRWPISEEAYAMATQEILSARNLEVLCLLVDSLRIRSSSCEHLLYPRSWTLKYLYIDCIYQPCLSKEELSRLAKRIPNARWITIANRETSRCLEFRRSRTAETISEMRLDSGRRGKEPRAFAPELYDVVWKGEEKMKYFIAEWCHSCEA